MKRFFILSTIATFWIYASGTLVAEDLITSLSPDRKFFAATRTVPARELIWKTDLDSTKLVIFSTLKDETIDRLYAQNEVDCRFVEKLIWSPDSKYIVFTTTSSGGHHPYHSNTYVFSIDDKSLRSMDSVTGMVLDSNFTIEPPDIAVVKIKDEKAKDIFELPPKDTKVILHEMFKKMGKLN